MHFLRTLGLIALAGLAQALPVDPESKSHSQRTEQDQTNDALLAGKQPISTPISTPLSKLPMPLDKIFEMAGKALDKAAPEIQANGSAVAVERLGKARAAVAKAAAQTAGLAKRQDGGEGTGNGEGAGNGEEWSFSITYSSKRSVEDDTTALARRQDEGGNGEEWSFSIKYDSKRDLEGQADAMVARGVGTETWTLTPEKVKRQDGGEGAGNGEEWSFSITYSSKRSVEDDTTALARRQDEGGNGEEWSFSITFSSKRSVDDDTAALARRQDEGGNGEEWSFSITYNSKRDLAAQGSASEVSKNTKRQDEGGDGNGETWSFSINYSS